MIRDDKERVIGKLISINSEKFVVELLNQSINFTINGFDDIYQYAQLSGYVILPYQDFHIVAEIFGIREKDSDNFKKGEKEQVLSKSNSIKYLDINPIGTIQKNNENKSFRYGVSIFPTLYTDVLYVRKEELDAIFEVHDEIIQIEGDSGTKLRHLHIGSSTIFPDYAIKVDINGFFGSHSAVLGNTGSGKSCTISSMIQTLFKKDKFSACGASFVFFDVNGEYHKAFSQITNPEIEVEYYSMDGKIESHFKTLYQEDITSKIYYKQFILPHWFLNIDEWALLLQASERTQLPILRNAINLLRMFSGNPANLNRIKNHILYLCLLHIFRDESSPSATKDRIIAILSKFNTTEINLDIEVSENLTFRNGLHVNFGTMNNIELVVNYLEQEDEHGIKIFRIDNFEIPTSNDVFRNSFDEIESALDLAILFEEAHGNNQIRDYCSSMLTRYKSLKDRFEFDFLTKNEDEVLKDHYINGFLGLNSENIKSTQVTIIDLNSIDDDVVEVISCVLSRMIFERLKTYEPRNTFPVNLVLEEAHRYIAETKGNSFGEANKIFNRIAKEGRKYGIFLLISSQRPSELSRTVLSQCSNFIVHRIQNPEDLSQIRQMTPHISANVLSRLPSIPKQHALIFGHSVQIPALFKVNDANPTPNSTDSDITKHWFIPRKFDESEFIDLLEDDIDF